VAMRPCLDCGVLTRDTRCAVCQRIWMRPRNRRRDARRGSPAQRSYGKTHKATRDALLPLAYGRPCPRCGELMLPGQPLDLGHSDGRRKKIGLPGDRIEHAVCNRSAGGRSAHGGAA
jgi:hypothetical protein